MAWFNDSALMLIYCLLATCLFVSVKLHSQNWLIRIYLKEISHQWHWHAVKETISIYIVGSGVRPPPFLFYPHPFYKGTLDTDNSGPPPF